MEIWHLQKNNIPNKITEISSPSLSGFLWIDCHPHELAEANKLFRHLTDIKIHDRHIEDCMNSQHPCAFESVQDYDILIVRSLINCNDFSELKTESVTFIIAEKVLMTVHNNDPAIARIRSRFEVARKKAPSEREILIYHILNRIVDNFLGLRLPLEKQYERWEALLLNRPDQLSNWASFLDFKSNIRNLRIVCEEQEDVISLWLDDIDVDISEHILVHIRDLLDHIRRVIRHTKQIDSDIESLIQLHYIVVSHRTNEIVRVLTVISCIFLPLTLITGIFGMNFQHMEILQRPHGYSITIIGMLILTFTLVMIFRWKRWI